MKSGDFTGLAKDYSSSRPDYSKSVLTALLGLMNKPANSIDFADVGAGTGIWTRMVNSMGVKSTTAVEPSDEMRGFGIKDSKGAFIKWLPGKAEKTGLKSDSIDMLTMASSFHWANFELAVKEFHRVLKNNGRFTALWNPRLIEVNPILIEIEQYLNTLRPDIKRVSSGMSGITNDLTKMLCSSPYFEDVVYLEGRHDILMSPDRYLGAWRSVNDLQVQLGKEKFESFLTFVKKKISDSEVVKATYLTRAWSARKKS